MKLFSSLFLFLTLAQPSSAATRTEAGFTAYASQYAQPEFYDSNSAAFSARLKLLDMAPAGAEARIATFEFVNGQSTRLLARHICLAAQRGVNVELLVDSKSGDRPGQPDAFDNSDDKQVVEELLQYMANCGATVYVHNPLESYVELFGFRMPNFFNDPAMEKKKLGIGQIITVLKRISFLMTRASEIVEDEFKRAGSEVDPATLMKALRSMALAAVQMMGGAPSNPLNSEFENAMAAAPSLRSQYDRLINDPVWDSASAGKIAAVLPRLEKRFRADSEFGPFGDNFRRYNRLNHRKLFLVESKESACMILGGRNLGDHYLEDGDKSFFDGDILLCRQHGAGANEAVTGALDSFESLKSDRDDPFLRSRSESAARRISANKGFVFRSLLFPGSLQPRGFQSEKYKGKLKAEARTLLRERKWRDESALHGRMSVNAVSWQLLRSGWDPAKDEIRSAFLEHIRKEEKQIFIETAYAEFDGEIRAALEAALARGVRVQLITNSLFTADGGSKLIRILMFTWTEKMKAAFPQSFQVHFTAYNKGQMTHFKAAAFGCQGGMRAYLLGSHNFHPRSGNADKEHSLLWREEGGCVAGLEKASLVQARHRFYNELARRSGKRVLAQYSNLADELTAVSRLYREGGEGTRRMARTLLEMFYDEQADGTVVFRNGARARKVFRLLDDSGLHDLAGRIL